MNGISNVKQRVQPNHYNSHHEAVHKTEDLADSDVNPFVHNITLTTFDKVKFVVLTILLAPLRIVCIAVCLITAYVLATIGLLGISEEELHEKPMSGWRRSLRSVISWWVQMLFFHGSFYRVTVKGVRADAKEAPLLTLAPHSSFFDALPVVVLLSPSLVVKADSQDMPFFAKLIKYTQPVFVWRDDPNSRQNTIKEIMRRATCKTHQWQQILIFPEGTCTNRKALITFKPGAFYPGVPVQPVCIRYPNRLDTISWTWQGPAALQLLWLTLTQFYTNCELEFLPVYTPNEEEKQNPKLYAENVRKVMAKALEVPVVDYTYEDCRLMNKARQLGLPPTAGLVCIQKLREHFGVKQEVIEKEMMPQYAQMADPSSGLVSLQAFASYLQVSLNEGKVKELYHLYDTDNTGFLTFKKFLVGRWKLAIPALERRSSQNVTLVDLQRIGVQTDLAENDVQNHLLCKPEWAWLLEQ